MLMISFVLGALFSAPLAHSHSLDSGDSPSHIEKFHIDDQGIHTEHDHQQGDGQTKHECCANHCHHTHATVLTNILAVFDPKGSDVQMAGETLPPLPPAYGVKRPPRTLV